MKDKEFTFVMLTYNQEKYVIEHMESIKYQVETYGKETKNYFLLCDDASYDGTVDVIKQWLEEHNLFVEVSIVVAKNNQGIVKNFMTALQNIHTEKFKLLAGDDLYSYNNVYDISELGDVTISPTIHFNSNGIIKGTKTKLKKILLSKNPERVLQKEMKRGYPLETPGVIWSKHLITEELYKELLPFTWIEDVPCMNYIMRQNVRRAFTEVPCVMYRMGCGISQNENHARNECFKKDVSLAQQKYCGGEPKLRILKRFVRLKFRIEDITMRRIVGKIVKQSKAFDARLERQVSMAENHYRNISNAAQTWLKKSGYRSCGEN